MVETPRSLIRLARDRLRAYAPRPLDAPAARPAAVLLLLYADRGAERLLFTRRTDRLEHHKGQISFPGGGADPDDADRAATALREAWEEIGVRPEDVELLGRLDDSLTNSNYLVAPFVGVLGRTPYEFVSSEFEVAEILEPPLAHLLDPANLVMETRQFEGEVVLMPAYHWEGHRIWGATARILEGFLALLGDGPDHAAHTPAERRAAGTGQPSAQLRSS